MAAGVSSTHLAQRFKELIGVTPKRLARTYRFAATVFAINPARPVDWGDLAGGAGYFDQAHFGHEFRAFTGSHRPGTSKSGGGSCANIPATRWTAGRCRPIDF
ncbi:helix-turn-helix domain-containing protein [Streptomyces sp. NPDC002054]|uniref:helix-turn-helix domain-containing protein n=1 Tax=Streptomyces sp. NPDC002054 TaxID=3154663 RepID=UPI00332F75B1